MTSSAPLSTQTQHATDFLAKTHEGQQITAHLSGLSQLIHDIQTAHTASMPGQLEHRHGKFALDNHLDIHFRAIQEDREYAEAVVHYLTDCASRLQSLTHSLTRRTDFRIDSFVRAFNDSGWTISTILATGSLHLVSTYGYLPRQATVAQLESENSIPQEGR